MAFRVDNCKADDEFTNSAHELHCFGCQKTKYGRDIVTISIGHWFVCSSSAWWFKKDVNAPLAAINISSRAFYSETANLLRCQIISLLFSKKRKKSNENSVWRSSIFPIMKPWCIFLGVDRSISLTFSNALLPICQIDLLAIKPNWIFSQQSICLLKANRIRNSNKSQTNAEKSNSEGEDDCDVANLPITISGRVKISDWVHGHQE